jgi:hypothetical protein
MTQSMLDAVAAFKTVYVEGLKARAADVRTVDEMDVEIHEARAMMGSFAMAAVIAQAVALAQRKERICTCGATSTVHRHPALRVYSMQGTHEADGIALRCDQCGRTERPVHEQLGVESYAKTTLLFERLSADFFLDKGAPTAVQRLQEHHGIEPGRTTVLRHAEESGRRARVFLDEKLQQAAAGAESRRGQPPRADAVFVQMDSSSGKTVAPLVRPQVPPGETVERTPVLELPKVQRPIEGRQVKLLCAQTKGTVDWVYDAFIGEYDEAPEKLVGLAATRGWQDGVLAVMTADGDDTIRTVAKGAFDPHLQMILDRQHAVRHLRDVISYGKEAVPTPPDAWLTKAKSLLHTGKVQEVIDEVKTIANSVEDASDKTKVDNVAIYFDKRADAVHYDHFKDQGWPIASGAVEGGHIHFIHPITKRGSGWLVDNLNHTISLACIRQSGWWEEFWQWNQKTQRSSGDRRNLN